MSIEQTFADVVVCGGGWGGCLAAIAAARSGASTLLIEEKGMLGGVATSSFMNSMTNLFMLGNNRQVVRGIPNELMETCVHCGYVSPWFRENEYRQIPYDLEGMHQVILEALWEAGVRIWTHAVVLGGIMEGDRLTAISVQTRGGLKTVKTKAAVDATGDLSLLHDCRPSVCRDEDAYSATLLFEVCNVDLDETMAYFVRHPEDYDDHADMRISFEGFQRNWRERDMFHLPHFGGHAIQPLQRAIDNGEYAKKQGLAVDCDAFAIFASRGSGKVLINSNFCEINELKDQETFSKAELDAREVCDRLYRVLKKYFPGFENALMTWKGTSFGSRRVRFLKGEKVLPNLLAPHRFEDVIGVAPLVDFSQQNGFFGMDGVEIPFGTLFNSCVENIVAGSAKSMSGDWAARHYTRLQPITMLLGQAAGTAAALMAKQEKSAARMDVKEIQRELLRQQAYLGEADRLRQLGLTE